MDWKSVDDVASEDMKVDGRAEGREVNKDQTCLERRN